MKIKRVYERPEKDDGTRILVDRLWPRGLTKEKAAVDLWLKDIAPSTALRKWFNHDSAKWQEFTIRYQEELKNNKSQVSILEKELQKKVTLLYASKDEQHNEALVLKEMFEKNLRDKGQANNQRITCYTYISTFSHLQLKVLIISIEKANHE